MLLKSIVPLLRGSNKLTFAITRLTDGRIQAVITPQIAEAPAELSDEMKQLRAVLGRPLVITSSDDEIDQAVMNFLNGQSEAQAEAMLTYETAVSDLQAATKKAKDAKEATTAKTTTAKKAGASKTPAATPSKPATESGGSEDDDAAGSETGAEASTSKASDGPVDLFAS